MTTATRTTFTAMACAAAVTAQFVGAKATRDALFLTSLDFTALPAMLIATSVCSILLVMAHTRWSVSIAPAKAVPLAFVASGLLFICEWFVRVSAPVEHGGAGLPARLGRRPPARVRLLAHCHGTLRPAHRETAFRTDFGRRHCRRIARRLAVRPRRDLGRPVDAARPRRAAVPQRLARTAARCPARTVNDTDPERPDRRRSRRLVGPARRCRIAAPASPRRTRAAGNDQRCAGRISLQGQSVRNAGTRRSSPAVFLALLCRNKLPHAARPAGVEPCGARPLRSRDDDEHAVDCAARRQRRGSGGARVRRHRRHARRRVHFPRIVVPVVVRAVLHADSSRRKARREVGRGRRLRSIGRCGRRRAGSVRRAAVAGRGGVDHPHLRDRRVGRRHLRREPPESAGTFACSNGAS